MIELAVELLDDTVYSVIGADGTGNHSLGPAENAIWLEIVMPMKFQPCPFNTCLIIISYLLVYEKKLLP